MRAHVPTRNRNVLLANVLNGISLGMNMLYTRVLDVVKPFTVLAKRSRMLWWAMGWILLNTQAEELA